VLPNVLGTRSLSSDLLEKYAYLSPDDAIALVRSARSYQEAVWIAEGDPQLAWLLLVSAVETAANQWWNSRDRTADRSSSESLRDAMPDLASLVETSAGSAVLDEVARHLGPLIKSREKFVRFLTAFCPEPPTPRPPKHWSEEGLKRL
jgi:hypothetical protein